MDQPPRPAVTQLLQDWSQGSREALDALLPLVHSELRKVAARHLGRERPGHTLQPTALVNEAYLRLVGQRDVQWQNRAHFVGVAAHLMRFILVDHHRKKRNAKRGGAAVRITFNEELDVADDRGNGDFLALDAALAKLAELDERKAKIAELKYFGGLNTEETAEALSISGATVVREWRLARAWLKRELTC